MPTWHRALPTAELPSGGPVENPFFLHNHLRKGRIAMTPNAAGWRSSAAYEHIAEMSPSDLAWEWLRRNDAYVEDYRELSEGKTDIQTLTDKIRRRWGLRFPRGPAGPAI
jgi:hypothetical protein